MIPERAVPAFRAMSEVILCKSAESDHLNLLNAFVRPKLSPLWVAISVW